MLLFALLWVNALTSTEAIKLLVKSQTEECVSHTIDLEQSQVSM